MRHSPRVGLLGVLLLMTGCGLSSSPQPSRPSLPPVPPQLVPTPGLQVPGQEPLRQVIQGLVAGMDATTSFESRYVSEEQVGGERRKSTYKMKFQKQPRISLLEVLDSTQIPKGFKVRDTGGDKVRVRLPGAASFISMEVPARSSQSRSIMGLYPDQVTPERFIEAFLDPASQIREAPGRVVEGQTLRCFEAVGPKAPLAGATVTLGIGDVPRFAYYLALRRPNGSSHVQTFSQLRLKRFSASELAL